jgi:hypothetical protein
MPLQPGLCRCCKADGSETPTLAVGRRSTRTTTAVTRPTARVALALTLEIPFISRSPWRITRTTTTVARPTARIALALTLDVPIISRSTRRITWPATTVARRAALAITILMLVMVTLLPGSTLSTTHAHTLAIIPLIIVP